MYFPSGNTQLLSLQESDVSQKDVTLLDFILKAFFEDNTSVVETGEETFCEEEEEVYCLKFKVNQKYFSFGIPLSLSSNVGLLRLLERLHSLTNPSVGKKPLIQLEAAEELTSEHYSRLAKYFCKRGDDSFPVLFAIDPDCRIALPATNLKSRWSVKILLYIDLGAGAARGPLSPVFSKLLLKSSVVSSEIEFDFESDLKLLSKHQEIELEAHHMTTECKIRTAVRLGALEISLEDFLSLKPGSKLSFCIPDDTEVELEVAGNLVATARLSSGPDSYQLNLTEIHFAKK